MTNNRKTLVIGSVLAVAVLAALVTPGCWAATTGKAPTMRM